MCPPQECCFLTLFVKNKIREEERIFHYSIVMKGCAMGGNLRIKPLYFRRNNPIFDITITVYNMEGVLSILFLKLFPKNFPIRITEMTKKIRFYHSPLKMASLTKKR